MKLKYFHRNVPNSALYQIQEEGKDQDPIHSSTTPDPDHQMEKW